MATISAAIVELAGTRGHSFFAESSLLTWLALLVGYWVKKAKIGDYIEEAGHFQQRSKLDY